LEKSQFPLLNQGNKLILGEDRITPIETSDGYDRLAGKDD
jgi:hypothetical protein